MLAPKFPPAAPRRAAANDNHDWWGAVPFTRRKIPLLILTFLLSVLLGAGIGEGYKRLTGRTQTAPANPPNP